MADRRKFLAAAATAWAAAAARSGAAVPVSRGKHGDLQGPLLDLRTGPGNALAMAKLLGSLNPAASKYGWYTGRLRAVVPGAAVRDLLTVVGFSAARTLPRDAQGRYALLRRECGLFLDLASGAILDSWLNPYTCERVDVVHIANDPVNQLISPLRTNERLYEQDVAPQAPEPYVLPWQVAGDRVFVEVASHLWARNPLDPAIWVRESAGTQIQISDLQTYSCAIDDLQNAALPSVSYQGNWVHVRPWQPWMLMGTAPGHLMYHCFTGSATLLGDVPVAIRSLVEQRLPSFLAAPEKSGKSEGSLSRYMRTRKPSPPRATSISCDAAATAQIPEVKSAELKP